MTQSTTPQEAACGCTGRGCSCNPCRCNPCGCGAHKQDVRIERVPERTPAS
ncbi:hypothetical protein KDL01_12460 [Actinospica durhamensis]|uniref:Metallothionein n=1 Tax=Actinospica durhamensis TaxID=1508375 RepID=A0A941ENB3_9ACTN|nr:hypothetical protein [Actinospica durhamensis]MBR7834083.1 hypothetical protein [Actinospica durhamensis]